MPIIIPVPVEQGLHDGPVTSENLRKWQKSYSDRKAAHNSTGVDTNNDPVEVYFNAKTLTDLVSHSFKYFVFFFECENVGQKHQKLSIMVCGMDSDCTVKTPFFLAHTIKGGTDTQLSDPMAKHGNFIDRLSTVASKLSSFNPFNEYDGYAHEVVDPESNFRKYVLRQTSNTKAVHVIVRMCVDKFNRYAPVFEAANQNYEAIDTLQPMFVYSLDNGTQCCPLPTT